MKNINVIIIAICIVGFAQLGLIAQTTQTSNNKSSNLKSNIELISIYPNPIQGKSTVSFYTKQNGVSQISAYSIDGKNIISINKNLTAGENSFQLSLPKGAYIIQIKGAGFSYSEKVISQSIGEIKPEIVFNGSVDSQTTTNPFKVSPMVSTTLVTTNVFNTSFTTATSGGTFVNGSSGYILYKGVCWSTSSAPTTANSKTTEGGGALNFTSYLTGLSPLTTYYLRAYSFSNYGITDYGNEVVFTTLAPGLAHLTTSDISSITSSTATSGGYIVSDQGAPITARGVCWSTNANPTVADSKTTDGIGTGGFNSYITGLTLGATYYVRAYATNLAGTSYGSQKSFIAVSPTLPILTTSPITSITSTTAISGGNISSDGGASVTVRGVCWSTTTNPTIANSKTLAGTGTGSFESSIGELTLGNTYYVRAYATNSVGTAYGPQVSFKTALAVGDNYEGAKVAYIFVHGDAGYDANVAHGLLAFPSDALTWSTWDDAVTACHYLGAGWRLPNINELKILFDNKDKIGEFGTASNCYYWSSTPDSTQPNYYLTIWFYTHSAGAIQTFQKTLTQPRVRGVINF